MFTFLFWTLDAVEYNFDNASNATYVDVIVNRCFGMHPAFVININELCK